MVRRRLRPRRAQRRAVRRRSRGPVRRPALGARRRRVRQLQDRDGGTAPRRRGVIVSTISGEAALLSGTPAKRRAKNATGGLLRQVGASGTLVVKDFTSILSMNRDTRAMVLAALREIYDGYWTRNVGTDGGFTLTWRGRLIVIGAVTTAWDRAYEVVSTKLRHRLPLRQGRPGQPAQGVRRRLQLPRRIRSRPASPAPGSARSRADAPRTRRSPRQAAAAPPPHGASRSRGWRAAVPLSARSRFCWHRPGRSSTRPA